MDVPVTNRPGVGWKVKDLSGPAGDLPFDIDSDVIAAAAIRIETGSEHFGNHADGRACAMHPAHEKRVVVARRKRQDRRIECIKDGREFLSVMRQRLAKAGHDIGRRLAPNRSLRDVTQMVNH